MCVQKSASSVPTYFVDLYFTDKFITGSIFFSFSGQFYDKVNKNKMNNSSDTETDKYN